MTIRAGERAVALLGAANRDPAMFERADDLVLDRDPNPHLGFGAGLHFCLGAPLARMELAVSWQVLLERMPRLALAGRAGPAAGLRAPRLRVGPGHEHRPELSG